MAPLVVNKCNVGGECILQHPEKNNSHGRSDSSCLQESGICLKLVVCMFVRNDLLLGKAAALCVSHSIHGFIDCWNELQV